MTVGRETEALQRFHPGGLSRLGWTMTSEHFAFASATATCTCAGLRSRRPSHQGAMAGDVGRLCRHLGDSDHPNAVDRDEGESAAREVDRELSADSKGSVLDARCQTSRGPRRNSLERPSRVVRMERRSDRRDRRIPQIMRGALHGQLGAQIRQANLAPYRGSTPSVCMKRSQFSTISSESWQFTNPNLRALIPLISSGSGGAR